MHSTFGVVRSLFWLITLVSYVGFDAATGCDEVDFSGLDQAQISEKVKEAHQLYIRGTQGDKEAVKKADCLLASILKAKPENAMATVLNGANYTLKARDTPWPNKKLGYARDGIKLMDKGVELDEQNIMVRWIRGENNIHMPGFLKRFQIAKKDLELIQQEVNKSPEDFEIPFRQKVGHLLGMAQYKNKEYDEAEKTWVKAKKLSPNSEISKKIAETSHVLSKTRKSRSLGPGRFRRK